MCFSRQCKINSLSGTLLLLPEGPARLNAEYWFSYIQGAITLSKPHKVKGSRFGLLVSHCIPSAHSVLHLCMPDCATSKKKRVIVATFSVSKIGLHWQQLERWKQTREERRTFICPLAFVSTVVDVFFCGGVRLYVTQASSIFCVISLFGGGGGLSHTHMCTHTPLPLWHAEGCILEVFVVGCRDAHWGGNTGPPRESAAICFISSLVNNVGGVLVMVVGAGGSGTEEKWSPSCKGLRLGRLKEIFMSVIWWETKQLIGPRHGSLCLQRQLIHLLLLLFLCPGLGWKVSCYCRLTLCMFTT